MQTVLTFLRDPVVRKRASETTLLFGTSAVITSAFAHYMYSVRVCKGPSMLPTLPTSRELVVVDKFSYGIQGEMYKYGDVVVNVSMRDPGRTACKRITGVAGDTIIYIDYNSNKLVSHVVDPGQVWLSGDNPLNSTDSRAYGQVPLGMLKGRVMFKFALFPPHFNRIDYLPPSVKAEERPNEYYYAKSYNLTRTDQMTRKDWLFLYNKLKDDKCSSSLLPSARARWLRVAEHKLKTLPIKKADKAESAVKSTVNERSKGPS